MKGEDSTVREELREIETGWVPWMLAAVYFPVYIVLDFAAGGLAATRLGLPQSVAVGLVSLSISAVVVLVFALVNLRAAVRRRTHSLGSSRGPVRRSVTRLVSPLAGAVRTASTGVGVACLTAFVAARDGVAMALTGIWWLVAGVGGIAYRVLALLARPFVLLAVVVTHPFRTVAADVAGGAPLDTETSTDEIDEPVDRRDLKAESTASSPLRRTDATSADGSERDPGDDTARAEEQDDGTTDDADVDVEPAVAPETSARDDVEPAVAPAASAPEDAELANNSETSARDDVGANVAAEASAPEDAELMDTSDASARDDGDPDVAPDAGALDDGESKVDADEDVVPGDPSGRGRVDDGDDPTDERSVDSGDSGERPVDRPDEDDWPDEWVSASDI